MAKKIERDKARKRLRALLLEIERHNRLYYLKNSPEISDFEYDCLQSEVKNIYQRFPDVKEESGPGSDLGEHKFAEVSHLSPMLSLANTYSKAELLDFYRHLSEKIGDNHSFILEPKVDGMALNLIYESGVWMKALTRGNGKVGEDVTESIRTIASIPKRLKGIVPERLEVRGEIYISTVDFLEINKEQEQLGLESFANARNLASGSVKLLDVKEVQHRRLQFVAHGIGIFEDVLATQYESRQWLKRNHFPVFPSIDRVEGFENIWNFIENFHTASIDLPYSTDGVVLKLNDRHLQAALGATAKVPRWAIAYKFEPEIVETRLKSVTFQVGRTGVITPVAELDPVDLSGSKISRATLHNFDEIKRKDICMGDWVFLQKAGEVIPAIISVNKNRRSNIKPIVCPQFCPVCGAPLVHMDSQVALRCPSIICPEQLRLKLVHFASKNAMDMVGVGSKVVDAFVEKGWVHHIADLFKLWQFRTQWIAMDGFGTTAVDQLLMAIEAAKYRPLWRFIYGLSISEIGIESAKNLAVHFKNLSALFAASQEDLQAVPLVGPCAAQSIRQFYSNPTNRSVLEELSQVGLILNIDEVNISAFENRKSFVFTGTLSQMTRDEAKRKVESVGGKISEAVSKKTFALIVGVHPGDKLQKAQQWGVTIWTENEFLNYLKDALH